jgi:hypothetical protein
MAPVTLERHSAVPALAAWVSLPLLLVWVTGVGVVFGRAR